MTFSLSVHFSAIKEIKMILYYNFFQTLYLICSAFVHNNKPAILISRI